MAVAVPGMAEAGTTKPKWLAARKLTAIGALVPVMELVTVSVTVMVSLLPEVRSKEAKNPKPVVRVVSAGSDACGSLLLKWTTPVYAVAVLPKASLAVTVNTNGLPATAFVGTEKKNWLGV